MNLILQKKQKKKLNGYCYFADFEQVKKKNLGYFPDFGQVVNLLTQKCYQLFC